MKSVVIVILFALAGAGFWYQKIYLPEQEKMAEMERELAKIKKEEEREAERKAREEKSKEGEVVVEEKPEPTPEPVEETKVAVVEPEEEMEEPAEEPPAEPEEEESPYGSKMEERDARLAQLTAQLDAKNAEFEKKRLELMNRKNDVERLVVETRGELSSKEREMNSGNLRKSATDQERILAPLRARYDAAMKQREEMEKEWNQYFSDRKLMENNYRAAVRKVINETR